MSWQWRFASCTSGFLCGVLLTLAVLHSNQQLRDDALHCLQPAERGSTGVAAPAAQHHPAVATVTFVDAQRSNETRSTVPPLATTLPAPQNCSVQVTPSMSPPPLFRRRHIGDTYGAMVDDILQQPPQQRRYLLLKPTGGWGNKLRAIIGALHVALLQRRILLLDAGSVGWIRAYFTPPVTPLYTNEAALGSAERNAWSSSPLRLECLEKDSQCSDERIVTVAAHFTLQHTLWRNNAAIYALNRMGVPIGRYDVSVQVLEWLLARPTARLLEAVADVKRAVDWHACALRVGMHFRSCIDCGKENRHQRGDDMSQTTFSCARQAVTAWQARALGADATPEQRRAQTCVYFAVDDVAGGWRDEAQQQLGDTASIVWHPRVTAFRNSAATSSLDDLDVIVSEWFMLGEAHFVFGTDTTFHQFAAMRTNAESMSTHMLRDGSKRWVCDPTVYLRPEDPVYPDVHF